MHDRAKLNILVGAGLFGLGTGVTWITFASAMASGGRFILAYGAILFGAVQFVVGLIQAFVLPPEPIDKALADKDENYRFLVGALASVVRNGRAPTANEISTIRRFVTAKEGIPISEEQVREATLAMLQENEGLIGFIHRKPFDRAMANKVIQGCYLVMTADAPNQRVKEVLVTIGMHLYLIDSEVEELVREAELSANPPGTNKGVRC